MSQNNAPQWISHLLKIAGHRLQGYRDISNQWLSFTCLYIYIYIHDVYKFQKTYILYIGYIYSYIIK